MTKKEIFNLEVPKAMFNIECVTPQNDNDVEAIANSFGIIIVQQSLMLGNYCDEEIECVLGEMDESHINILLEHSAQYN